MASQPPSHHLEQLPQPHTCVINPSPCTHPPCHITCGFWRCCQCRVENRYNVLWCACSHVGCKECALVHEGCRISPPRESSERREPVTEPAAEEKEGWSSEGWETSDDGEEGGKKGKKKEGKNKKPFSTCWMFWECCGCGENNAPARGKCRKCARVKCDWCYRRLPKRAAVWGDFI